MGFPRPLNKWDSTLSKWDSILRHAPPTRSADWRVELKTCSRGGAAMYAQSVWQCRCADVYLPVRCGPL